MAFQFHKDDKRGNPKIAFVEGQWEALGCYYTSTKKLDDARAYCRKLNAVQFLRGAQP